MNKMRLHNLGEAVEFQELGTGRTGKSSVRVSSARASGVADRFDNPRFIKVVEEEDVVPRAVFEKGTCPYFYNTACNPGDNDNSTLCFGKYTQCDIYKKLNDSPRFRQA